MKLKRVVLLAIMLCIIGFVRWEHRFSFEIRRGILATLLDETLGFTGLLLLSGCIIINAMQFKKGSYRAAIAITPVMLVIIIFCWKVSMFGKDKWEDQLVYTNGNEY